MDDVVTSDVVMDEGKTSFASMSVSAAAVSTALEPVTLDEAKAQMRVHLPDDDAHIERLIRAARMALEGRIQRAIVPQSVIHRAPSFAAAIRLPLLPYLGDLEISYTDAAGELVVLDPTSYELSDDEPPYIHAARGQYFPTLAPWPGTVRVQYTAGYANPAAVPDCLKQWILMAACALYDNRSPIVVGVSVAQLPDDFMHMLYSDFKVYR